MNVMEVKMKYIVAAFCFLANVPSARSQADSLERTGWRKYWNSLIHGNVDRTFEKKLDMSFVVVPCYTREGSFGIGGAATALYRLDRRDSTMQPSDFSLSGSASIRGVYTLTAKGNNNFRDNKSRLSYRLQLFHKTLDFWGVSFDACARNPMSEYTKRQVKWEADYIYKLTRDIHVGVAFNLNYTGLSEIADEAYLEGQKKSYFFSGIGISVQYDTRDFMPNPRRGIYIMAREVFYPAFMGSCDEVIFSTTVVFDAFLRLWRGGVLATDVYGQFFCGEAPWVLREELGSGGSRMRSYYAGRYLDRNQMVAQAELRQHLHSRVGCAAWIGGGAVFPSLKELRGRHFLPNYGLGLRIEFKHNVNIRIDYGFGKDTGGFVFQFAEAF